MWAASACLQQVKIDLHASAACHRFSVAVSGAESPLSHGLHRFLIERQTRSRDHAHVGGAPGFIDVNREHDRALKLRLARLFGKFGLNFEDQFGRCDVAYARAYIDPSGTVPRPDAATTAAIAN